MSQPGQVSHGMPVREPSVEFSQRIRDLERSLVEVKAAASATAGLVGPIADAQKIQSDSVIVTTTAANTTASQDVSFSAMQGTPDVTVTPYSSQNSSTGLIWWVTGRSSTGFTLNIQRSSATTTTFGWTAIAT